jgi:hypothetical protein
VVVDNLVAVVHLEVGVVLHLNQKLQLHLLAVKRLLLRQVELLEQLPQPCLKLA